MKNRWLEFRCCIIALLVATCTGAAQDNGAATPGLKLFETSFMSRVHDRVVELDFGAAGAFDAEFALRSFKYSATATVILFDGRVRLTGGTDNYLADHADKATPVIGVSGTVYEDGGAAFGAKYLYRDVSYDRWLNHEFLHYFEIGGTWIFPSIAITLNPGFAIAENGKKYAMLSGGIAPKLSQYFWLLIEFNQLGFLTQQDHYGFGWVGLRYVTDSFSIDYGTYILGHRIDMSFYF